MTPSPANQITPPLGTRARGRCFVTQRSESFLPAHFWLAHLRDGKVCYQIPCWQAAGRGYPTQCSHAQEGSVNLRPDASFLQSLYGWTREHLVVSSSLFANKTFHPIHESRVVKMRQILDDVDK